MGSRGRSAGEQPGRGIIAAGGLPHPLQRAHLARLEAVVLARGEDQVEQLVESFGVAHLRERQGEGLAVARQPPRGTEHEGVCRGGAGEPRVGEQRPLAWRERGDLPGDAVQRRARGRVNRQGIREGGEEQQLAVPGGDRCGIAPADARERAQQGQSLRGGRRPERPAQRVERSSRASMSRHPKIERATKSTFAGRSARRRIYHRNQALP